MRWRPDPLQLKEIRRLRAPKSVGRSYNCLFVGTVAETQLVIKPAGELGSRSCRERPRGLPDPAEHRWVSLTPSRSRRHCRRRVRKTKEETQPAAHSVIQTNAIGINLTWVGPRADEFGHAGRLLA